MAVSKKMKKNGLQDDDFDQIGEKKLKFEKLDQEPEPSNRGNKYLAGEKKDEKGEEKKSFIERVKGLKESYDIF